MAAMLPRPDKRAKGDQLGENIESLHVPNVVNPFFVKSFQCEKEQAPQPQTASPLPIESTTLDLLVSKSHDSFRISYDDNDEGIQHSSNFVPLPKNVAVCSSDDINERIAAFARACSSSKQGTVVSEPNVASEAYLEPGSAIQIHRQRSILQPSISTSGCPLPSPPSVAPKQRVSFSSTPNRQASSNVFSNSYTPVLSRNLLTPSGSHQSSVCQTTVSDANQVEPPLDPIMGSTVSKQRTHMALNVDVACSLLPSSASSSYEQRVLLHNTCTSQSQNLIDSVDARVTLPSLACAFTKQNAPLPSTPFLDSNTYLKKSFTPLVSHYQDLTPTAGRSLLFSNETLKFEDYEMAYKKTLLGTEQRKIVKTDELTAEKLREHATSRVSKEGGTTSCDASECVDVTLLPAAVGNESSHGNSPFIGNTCAPAMPKQDFTNVDVVYDNGAVKKPRTYNVKRSGARKVLKVYKAELKERAPALLLKAKSGRAYDQQQQILRRQKRNADGTDPGYASFALPFGCKAPRLPSSKAIRKEASKVDLGEYEFIYSIPAYLCPRASVGTSLCSLDSSLILDPLVIADSDVLNYAVDMEDLDISQEGVINCESDVLPPSLACSTSEQHGENTQQLEPNAVPIEKPKVIGIIEDLKFGVNTLLIKVAQYGEGSPLLKEALKEFDSKLQILSIIDMSDDLRLEGGWHYGTAVVHNPSTDSVQNINVKFVVLSGIFWADGFTPDGRGRLMSLLWLHDKSRELITKFDGLSEPTIVAHLRGSESCVYENFAFGPSLLVSPLAARLNSQLDGLQKSLFILRGHDKEAEVTGFVVDVNCHSIDGSAISKMTGLTGGHGDDSQPSALCRVFYKDMPTCVTEDGDEMELRNFEEMFVDFQRTLQWWSCVPILLTALSQSIVLLKSVGAESDLRVALDLLKQVKPLDLHKLAEKHDFHRAIAMCIDQACNVVNTDVWQKLSPTEATFICLVLLIHAKTAVLSGKGLGVTQSKDTFKFFCKVNGDMQQVPWIYLNGNKPRPWAKWLNLAVESPYLAFRALHSVWKIDYNVLMECLDNGLLMYVKQPQGLGSAPLPPRRLEKGAAKCILRKLTLDAGKKDVSGSQSVVTRKDTMQLLDLYTSDKFARYFSHSWLALMHLARIVSRLFTLTTHDGLPEEYIGKPEILIAAYSVALVSMYEALVTSKDQYAAHYRQDCLLAHFQVARNKVPIGVESEDKGEGYLPHIKNKVRNCASRDLATQFLNLSRLHVFYQHSAAKFLSNMHVTSKQARDIEGGKELRTVALCNLIVCPCLLNLAPSTAGSSKWQKMFETVTRQILNYEGASFRAFSVQNKEVADSLGAPIKSLVFEFHPALNHLLCCACSIATHIACCTSVGLPTTSVTATEPHLEQSILESGPQGMSAEHSFLRLDCLRPLRAGLDFSCTLCLRNQAGEPVSSPCLLSSICLITNQGATLDPSFTVKKVEPTLTQGEFKIFLTAPFAPGTYPLLVKVCDIFIGLPSQASEQGLVIVPGNPDPDRTVVGDVNGEVSLGQEFSFEVWLKDKYGNYSGLDYDPEKFRVSSSVKSSASTVTLCKLLLFSVQFTVAFNQPGCYALEIFYGGTYLGRTKEIVVSPPVLPEPSFCTVTVPANLSLCGPVRYKLAVTLRDAAKNPFPIGNQHMNMVHILATKVSDPASKLCFEACPSDPNKNVIYFECGEQLPSDESPPSLGIYDVQISIGDVVLLPISQVNVLAQELDIQNAERAINAQVGTLKAKVNELEANVASLFSVYGKTRDDSLAMYESIKGHPAAESSLEESRVRVQRLAYTTLKDIVLPQMWDRYQAAKELLREGRSQLHQVTAKKAWVVAVRSALLSL